MGNIKSELAKLKKDAMKKFKANEAVAKQSFKRGKTQKPKGYDR